MVYRAKKDRQGALLFLAIPLLGTIVGVMLICNGIGGSANPDPESVRVALTAGGAAVIALCALVAWSYLSASYEITPEKLIVRFGPIRLRYQLSFITEAIATNALLVAGPVVVLWRLATSFDSVYVVFRNSGTIAISPDNKAEFLRELADRVPGLSVRGEGT